MHAASRHFNGRGEKNEIYKGEKSKMHFGRIMMYVSIAATAVRENARLWTNQVCSFSHY